MHSCKVSDAHVSDVAILHAELPDAALDSIKDNFGLTIAAIGGCDIGPGINIPREGGGLF